MLDNFDAEQAAYERANRTQKPEFAPGMGGGSMGDFGGGVSDPFGSGDGVADPFGSSGADPFGSSGADPFGSSGGASDPFGSSGADPFGSPSPFGASPFGAPSPFGSPAGGGMMDSFAGGNSMFGMQGQNQQAQPKAPEDKFFDALKAIGVGIKDVGIDLIKSFNANDVKWWNSYFLRVAIVCGVLLVLNVIASLFGYPGMKPIISCILCGSISFASFFFTFESAASFIPQAPAPMEQPADPMPATQSSDFSSFDFDEDDDEEGWVEEDESSAAPSEPSGTNYDWVNNSAVPNYDSIINDIPVATSGMGLVTRENLFGTFCQFLRNFTLDYQKRTELTEQDEMFLKFDHWAAKISSVFGWTKTEDIPILSKVVETKFGYELTFNRPAKMKNLADKFADELRIVWAYDLYGEGNLEGQSNTFYKTYTVLDELKVCLYSGKLYTLSVKDMYAKTKDWVLDTKNILPVMIGTGDAGQLYYVDLTELKCMIFAGLARSGKTWTAKSFITQLMALNSPTRIQFMFLDAKAASDWLDLRSPHVISFANKYRNLEGKWVNEDCERTVLGELKWLDEVEVPRRNKLLLEANEKYGGIKNFNDFRDVCRDVEVSTLYVVVDEMTSFGISQYKEDKKYFDSILAKMVSQYPNLDVKAMFITHEIKDQVIATDVYRLIVDRFIVNAKPDVVKTYTEEKGFTYKLVNPGDMAMSVDKVAKGTVYCKSAILTDKNVDMQRITDSVGKMWAKQCPDSIKNSFYKDYYMNYLKEAAPDWYAKNCTPAPSSIGAGVRIGMPARQTPGIRIAQDSGADDGTVQNLPNFVPAEADDGDGDFSNLF